jgi:putative FmdB family regulatory protein
MPTYQYHCSSCNKRFEAKQSFYDTPTVCCPVCQNGARRVFSPVPIIFKGSGFYVTDNAKKTEAQYSPKSESKSETKQEEKTQTPATSVKGSEDKTS